MTTKHTITHADEIHVGNAFQGGYSPDGRRGIKMTHLYLHKFLSTAGTPAALGDTDGIFSSMLPSKLTASGANLLSLATGALVSAGSTIINFDVPRNIVFKSSNTATGVYLKVEGLDQYGEPMAEAIKGGGAGAFASGKKCFKSINKIFTTAAFTTTISVGTGNRLGVPFHLQTKDQVVAVTCDGKTVTSGGTGLYAINIGASYATTITSSGGQPDVRGNLLFSNPALNGTRRYAALIEVDHTTQRKAFGPPQASSCTNGV